MSALAELQELYNVDPDIERISLRGKELEQIDLEMQYLQHHFAQIRHLDLSENLLETLPFDFGQQLPKLVALDLTKNKFQSISDIAQILQGCSSLKSLSISLKNPTEEKLLLTMLTKLRILNGTPLQFTASAPTSPLIISPPPPPLSLNLEISEENAKSNPDNKAQEALDSTSRNLMSSTGKPSSPQEKRTLRLQFANLKQEASRPKYQRQQQQQQQRSLTRSHPLALTKKLRTTTLKSNSVRPTEQLATITDDKTDWQKLLKRKHQHLPDNRPIDGKDAAILTTEGFLNQLKVIVKTFHQCDQKNDDDNKLVLYEQLDQHVDLLSTQLKRLERQSDDIAEDVELTNNDQYRSSAEIKRLAKLLETRWSLLEVCGLYGVEKATACDEMLGKAFEMLLYMQKEVLAVLQSQLTVQSKSSLITNNPHQHLQQMETKAKEKQQLKVLLEVAETLEADLEALQTKLHQEKAQRELLEQENATLKRENDAFKRKSLSFNNRTTKSSRMDNSAASSIRRIRQRSGDMVTNISNGLETKKTPARSPEVTVSDLPLETTTEVSSTANTSTNLQPELTRVRNLTLKQLVDLIQAITTSKRKYDARTTELRAPRETMEQHMYTYLNQRFGLHVLIVDYASAIWKGCEAFARQENDVAVFFALLRNQIDDGFVIIKKKLQQALVELLRAYFQAKYPMKQELAITTLVKNRLQHRVYEEEWTALLTYLYDPQDSARLLHLVRRKCEKWYHQQPLTKAKTISKAATATALSLPFVTFEQVLYDYQFQGRLKLLESFRHIFEELDEERIGILTQDTFTTLVRRIAPQKTDYAIEEMIETLDPFHHDAITFSDAVNSLLPEIRSAKNASNSVTKPHNSARTQRQ